MLSTVVMKIAGKLLDFTMECLRLFIRNAGIEIILLPHGKQRQQKGGPTMALVTYTLDIGIEPTPEEQELMRMALEAAKKLPFVYDPDYPPLTEAQLAQFHPVNGMTWEERARLMRECGIVDPEAQESAVQTDAVRVPAMV
jgi:hypothetical protein